MSNTKTVMSQAANTQGIPLDITDVFSTYLYTGNGSTQTITNDIDLDGEGGLVWIKNRDFADNHMLLDTERGNEYLISNENFSEAGTGTAFVTTSEGFNIVGSSFDDWNASNENYASWTFRKAPKFFDVVTYTGTGIDQLIPHNLGCVPGFVVVKKTSGTGYWSAWHRTFTSNEYILLDLTNAATPTANVRTVTDTHYEVHGGYADENQSGATYVAYLFAHNDGDGEFGPSGDQDIIKCGSYTGNGSSNGPEINLGFEPQWLLVKNASGVSNWLMVDNMRGFPVGSNNARLFANLSNAEVAFNGIDPTATGFKLVNSTGGYNTSGNDYIYIAIRRGPLAPPESATEVFAIDTQGSTGDGQAPAFRSTFPVDTAFVKSTAGGGTTFASRLTGTKYLRPEETSAEYTNTQVVFDYMNGFRNNTVTFAPNHGYLWKRAPNFFDVVAYTGDGTAGRTVSHNLGVAPEMIWVKRRSSSALWAVYNKDLGNTKYIQLHSNAAAGTLSVFWNNTSPTSMDFTVGTYTAVNGNADTFIAYLFASLDGISKVGSYTGNGTSQTIDCGFTSGARFILVKRTDSTGDWYVWDTERGIVAGNDPYLELNTTDAEVTSTDWVDPDNSGFIVNGTTINASSAEYIFYAIA